MFSIWFKILFSNHFCVSSIYIFKKINLFSTCSFHCQVDRSSKRTSKKNGKKHKKASFKVNRRGKGLKSGKKDKKGPEGDEEPLTYKGTYDLSKLPRAALPDTSKPNKGLHSYTLLTPCGKGSIEVLLRHNAYFVKKISPSGTGPCGQVSFARFGGEMAAWGEATRRAGF